MNRMQEEWCIDKAWDRARHEATDWYNYIDLFDLYLSNNLNKGEFASYCYDAARSSLDRRSVFELLASRKRAEKYYQDRNNT